MHLPANISVSSKVLSRGLRRSGYVYCVRDDAAEAVKIGFSKNPRARLYQLQTAHAMPLRMVCVFEHSQAYETLLHFCFASRRLHGEWFSDDDRRVSSLLQMAATGGEA